MSEIGAGILQLLVGHPDEWDYSHEDAVVHTRTKICIAPSVPDQIVIRAGGQDRSAALTPEDHAGIYRQVVKMLAARRADQSRDHKLYLSRLLNPDPQCPPT
jgi:hypothetical protein